VDPSGLPPGREAVRAIKEMFDRDFGKG